MQVNVNTYLNARIGSASTRALCIDFRLPGESLDIDRVLIGDEINGNAIWYRNKQDNCFYWSEGIVEQSFLLEGGDIYTRFSAADQHVFLRSFIYAFQSVQRSASKVLNLGITQIQKVAGLIIEVASEFDNAELNLKDGQLIFKGAVIPFKISPATNFKPNIYADVDLPLVLGGSVANAATGYTGSRGIKVNRIEQAFLLTCYHVACYSLMKNSGLTEYDGSLVSLTIPSPLSTTSTVGPYTSQVSEGVLNMYFDYAAAPITDDLVGNFVPQQGFINNAYSRADFNQLTTGTTLRSFGCMTGYATGKITQINLGKTYIDYDYVGTIGIIETIETERLSVEGDSGGPVFDATMNLVGLIIGNNENTNRSLIMPIHQLFFNKSFSL